MPRLKLTERKPFSTTVTFHVISLLRNNLAIMNSLDFKLRERIKELNCLYELSKAALHAQNDLSVIISRTLEILPEAMQHQLLAEASITVNGKKYSSAQFHKCKF